MLINAFGKSPKHDHRKHLDLELYVWHENGEMYYIYTPGANINFVTDKPNQTLTISLVSPPNQLNRFNIHSYSIRDKSMCQKVFYYDAQGSEIELPMAKGHLFESGTTKAKFELALLGAGTYITLNVIDITNSWIISCDPQVENGTKTNP
jgi:hypothetical protein